MEEVWKDVVGYEDYFKISEYGKVYSKRTNKELKLTTGKTGYKQFCTRFDGRKSKAKLFKVHIMVCEAFNGPRPNEHQRFALHWDDDKLNNHYSNLRWGSRSENAKDLIRNGKSKVHLNHKKGQDNPDAKLSDEKVFDIMENFSKLGLSSRRKRILYFCEKYDVSYSTVRGVVDGIRWIHLTEAKRLD